MACLAYSLHSTLASLRLVNPLCTYSAFAQHTMASDADQTGSLRWALDLLTDRLLTSDPTDDYNLQSYWDSSPHCSAIAIAWPLNPQALLLTAGQQALRLPDRDESTALPSGTHPA